MKNQKPRGNMGGMAGGQPPQMPIDLTTTTGVKNSKGTSIFKSAGNIKKNI